MRSQNENDAPLLFKKVFHPQNRPTSQMIRSSLFYALRVATVTPVLAQFLTKPASPQQTLAGASL
jgi:hypothetical protein